MRLTEFVVVIVAALLFLIPTMKKENRSLEREAQEERPMERQMEEAETSTFKVTYEVKSPDEESVADILWMKRAAQIAREEGIPYFNVLEQHITKRFVNSANMELSVIEGVIELDGDPMRAEFDANEIESLVLTNSP